MYAGEGAKGRHWVAASVAFHHPFVRLDLSLNQDSIDLARAGQGAPGICLAPPALGLQEQAAVLCLHVDAGDPNSGHHPALPG